MKIVKRCINVVGIFTMVELLVVISIIMILVAMLMPALNSARSKARLISCVNLQKQLGTALISYSIDSNGLIPGWAGTVGGTQWYYKLQHYSPDLKGDPAKTATCPEYRAAIGKPTDATNTYSVRAGILSTPQGPMTPLKIYKQSSSKMLMLAEGFQVGWNCPFSTVDGGASTVHGRLSLFHIKTGTVTFQDGHTAALTAHQMKKNVFWPWTNGNALATSGVMHINPDFKSYVWETF